jgi:hypothetical protein
MIIRFLESFLSILRIFPKTNKLMTAKDQNNIEAKICTDINKVIMRIEKTNEKREKNLQGKKR